MDKEPIICTIDRNSTFAENVAESIGIDLMHLNVIDFACGENKVNIPDNIRDRNAYLIATEDGWRPGNTYVERFEAIEALQGSGAKVITLVRPFENWTRQDRTDSRRESLNFKLVPNLENFGMSWYITMDLHSPQLENLFKRHPYDLWGSNIFAEVTKNDHINDLENITITSPDPGGIKRNSHYRSRLTKNTGIEYPLAFIDKERTGANISKTGIAVGEINNKIACIHDDIYDTGGTLHNSASILKESGAKEVHAYITHGLITGKGDKPKMGEIAALQRTHPDWSYRFIKMLDEQNRIWKNSELDGLVITNSRPELFQLMLDTKKAIKELEEKDADTTGLKNMIKKTRIIGIEEVIAEAIKRHISGQTIRGMWDQFNKPTYKTAFKKELVNGYKEKY